MRSLACMLVTLAALAAAPACSKILGIEGEATLGGTVSGRSYARHLTPEGGVDVPFDLSQAVLQALIVDESQASGYRVSVGTGNADGTFAIPDVPDGAAYLLKLVATHYGVTSTSYFAVTHHDIDHHFDLATRGDPAPQLLSSPTKVSFNVQGMSPFIFGPERVSSSILLGSLRLGYYGSLQLANNARSVVQLYDWGRGFYGLSPNGVLPQPLPEAALGDDLTILHMRTEYAPNASERKNLVTRVIDVFTPSGVTIANGTTTGIAGNWQAAGAIRSFTLSVMRGTFDANHGNNIRPGGVHVALEAAPLPSAALGSRMFLFGAPVFSVNFRDWTRLDTLDETLGVTYSDPFPADWSRYSIVSYYYQQQVRLPNAMPANLTLEDLGVLPYIGGNLAISSTLSPPANLEVAGKDAIPGGLTPFDGTVPIKLTWRAVVAAKSYLVSVRRVFKNGAQTDVALVATFSTSQTSIQIPAEVFTGSEFFVFEVASVQTPASYDDGQVIANGLPFSIARTVSGMFRLSNQCGNGTIDPGEECDTNGESAMCDVDCTLPLCGDGLRNVARGEACDSVGNTIGCDADCTLPVCGDGHRNDATEDCEDGNTSDNNNGCSSTCRFNNVCGDGFVQNFVEECDQGGVETSVCDIDCTIAFCGDGHHNAIAGEQCDDGNSGDTDGCTGMCKTM